MAKLTEAELKAYLSEMEGWTFLANAIHREFAFPGFRAAIAFVNRVAESAEGAGHHPDIEIHYNRVYLSLSTHDAGGVTEKDIALAAEIDRAATGGTPADSGGG
jgi:4a-hydroxytetrahydrobiopterin dehydratase